MTEKNVTTENEAIAELTRAGMEPVEIEFGRVYVFRDSAGSPKVIDSRNYGDVPFRKTSKVVVRDADSFATYINKHAATDETTIYVDDTNVTAVAVIDDDDQDLAGWREHRAHLKLTLTPEWDQWLSLDGQMISQVKFAELIEDNQSDIARPPAAEMLEIAQSLQAKNKVEFESSQYLADGHRGLVYKETVDARAGEKGRLDIPATFDLGLRPFVGSDAYKVTARFRYRISDGKLAIGYKLNQPELVLRAAFDDVVKAFTEKLDDKTIIILNGLPG